MRRLVIGAVAAIAVVAAVMRTVIRRRRGTASAESAPPARRRLRCRCGEDYEVVGIDRHRVFWRAGEPVLGDDCPVCGVPLGETAPEEVREAA